MAARLLLLAAAAAAAVAVAAAAAVEIPEYASWWGGPPRGCAGALEAEQLSAYCALRAGNVTVAVNRAATWLAVTCEDNSTFACDELAEARPLIDEYVTVRRTAAARVLDRFELKNCLLPAEELRCVMALVGAADARLVRLQEMRGAVQTQHVRGMAAVEKFRVYYKRGVNVSTVPYDVLSKLPALRSFSSMRGALVLAPDAEQLPTLERLRMLELADGGLRTLPRGAFRNSPNVENLLLWSNEIEHIDEDAFLGLSLVVNMSLNSNRLRALPPRVLRPCARLANLDLYNNALEALPHQLFQGLQHLTEVKVFGNQATLKLENGVFSNLPSLYHVKMDSSDIQTLPEDLFQNSTSLHQLDLSNNLIESLPPGIFHGLKLRVLYLGNNKLENVSAQVFLGQDKLEELDLSRNGLEQLEEGIFHHTKSLKVLNLGDNNLDSLDKSVFNHLSQLLELDLSGNRIQYLHSATFDVIDKLEMLSLSRNDLPISRAANTLQLVPMALGATYGADATAATVARTSQSPLGALRALRTLDLSHNRVSLVCDDWRLLPHLETLDLSHNSLEELTSTDMYFARAVAVDVSHNRIRTFQPNAYPPSLYRPDDIPTFRLDGNPFLCDCGLYDFVALHSDKTPATKLLIDDSVCAEPSALNGTYLTELTPDQMICPETDCPTNCSCIIRPSKLKMEVHCSRFPSTYPPKTEGFTTQLRLSEPNFPPELQIPSDLVYINLSGLNLTEPPLVNSSVELNLSDNRLVKFPVELLKSNCTVQLRNNPFDCGCSNVEQLEFLNRYKHLVTDYSVVVCESGVLVSGIETDRLCVARNATIIGCAVALFGVFIAVLTAVVYKFQTEIRIILRIIGCWCWEDEVGYERFDVFVSYAHQDELYVLKTLVPRLESGKNKLKVCIHERNWRIGGFIPTQISDSVKESRWTIIVLSQHFLNSVWAQMEFREAHAKDKLLILMLDDPKTLSTHCSLDADLRAYVALNTYVRADHPLVYERLKDAVLRKRKPFVKPRQQTDKQIATNKQIADKQMNKQITNKPTNAVGLNVQLNKDGKLVNNALTAPPCV